jgi:hypothetical protein
MPHGNRINGALNVEPNRFASEHESHGHDADSHHDSSPPSLKLNAAQLFRNDWQNSQANELKNNLLTSLPGGSERAENAHQTFSQTTTTQTIASYANQSLESLINLAREHKDFKTFQNHTENFWENVSRMSEVRILTSSSGETNLASRYAELSDKFSRQGGGIETFVRSLPDNEREVFAARYQLEKTFGAGKLFVGNGVTLDKNGDFNLRAFLSGNNKSVDLPLNFVLALRESGLLGASDSMLAGRLLFNDESAALLGMSLALYQNAGANVNLKDAIIYTLFQQFVKTAGENASSRQPSNQLANADATAKKSFEPVIVGALINGSLSSIDKRAAFFDKINLEAFSKGENSGRIGFAAGAAGAMLGAAIGCLVPISGNAAGRATGLATSIVVGTTTRGLRSLNVNLLISDAVTNAVQTLLDTVQDNFLTASPQTALPAASPLEDLNSNLFNRRLNAFLTA